MLYPPLLGINKPSDDDDDDVLRKVNVIEVIGNYTDYMKLSPGVTSKMVYVPRSTCFKKFMNIIHNILSSPANSQRDYFTNW